MSHLRKVIAGLSRWPHTLTRHFVLTGDGNSVHEHLQPPKARHRPGVESRDERLFVMAADHHNYAADRHATAATWHERRGDRDAADRERALAQDARDKARRLERTRA